MPQLLEAKQYTMMLFGLHLLGAHMLQHYGMTNLVMQHCCHVSVASLGRPDHILVGLMLDQHWHFATWIVQTGRLQALSSRSNVWNEEGKEMWKKQCSTLLFSLCCCVSTKVHLNPWLNHPSLFHEWMDQSQKIKIAIMEHTDTHA